LHVPAPSAPIDAEALAFATGIDARAAFDAVLLRERLAGTGVGEGVAIPHALMPGLKRPVGVFARLEPAQDFEALDGRPADLVFMLLSPADMRRRSLESASRAFRAFSAAPICAINCARRAAATSFTR
jgi:PTS system nitrogen regulatory IIA component